MLVELRENSADVQMSVGLDFGTLEPRFNGEGPLQEVESCAHFTDPAIIAGHIVKSHGLAKFVVFTELFRLFQQVQGTVDILFLEIVDCEDVTDLAELLASACEFTRGGSEMHLLHPEELLQDADGFNIFALHKRQQDKEVSY